LGYPGRIPKTQKMSKGLIGIQGGEPGTSHVSEKNLATEKRGAQRADFFGELRRGRSCAVKESGLLSRLANKKRYCTATTSARGEECRRVAFKHRYIGAEKGETLQDAINSSEGDVRWLGRKLGER